MNSGTSDLAKGSAGFWYGLKESTSGRFQVRPEAVLVTDTKFPGNVTRSFRIRQPMRFVAEVESWEGHPLETLQAMVHNLTRLRAEGRDTIED